MLTLVDIFATQNTDVTNIVFCCCCCCCCCSNYSLLFWCEKKGFGAYNETRLDTCDGVFFVLNFELEALIYSWIYWSPDLNTSAIHLG